MPVVNLPLLRVTQYGVGCVDLLEYFCCLRVPWILVWMILQGQSPTQAIPKGGWGEDGNGWGGRVRVNDRDRSLDGEKRMHEMWYKGWRHAAQVYIPSRVTMKRMMAPPGPKVKAWGFKNGSESKVEGKGFKGENCRNQ